MIERRPRRRQDEPPAEFETPWGTVGALVLLALGMAGYLSLISYDPRDIHDNWFFCSSLAVTDRPNEPVNNIIGPVGGYLAGCAYLVFGAAAYLLPTSMVWFGVSMLISRQRLTARSVAGVMLLMITGPALLSVQETFFKDWARDHRILNAEPGGGLGLVLGKGIIMASVGRVGAFLLLLTGYVAGLIMLTGFHPMQFLLLSKEAMETSLARLRAARAARPAFAGGPALPRENTPSVDRGPPGNKRGRRRIGNPVGGGLPEEPVADHPLVISAADVAKKLGLTGAEPPPVAPSSHPLQMELPLPAKPEPKIIDSSIRQPKPADRPSLADIRRKSKEQKQATASLGTGALSGDFANYELPDLDLLQIDETAQQKPADVGTLMGTQQVIIRTLATFGINVTPGDITRGPTITRYEIYPEEGLRVSRISSLEADLARATKAERINILAPIPGKDTVGIEIANHDKVAVPLRELLEDPAFTNGKAKLPLALGKDVYGNTIVGDLASMPHLLVAGTTGSGKSVCINSIIGSLLFQFTPDQLRFIMIDPKVVEMQQYNDLPHLVIPVVTDPKKTLVALNWVVNEMENRYRVFARTGVRNFDTFNKRPRGEFPSKTGAVAQGPSSRLDDGKLEDCPTTTQAASLRIDDDKLEACPTESELENSALHALEVRFPGDPNEGDLDLDLDSGRPRESVWTEADDHNADEKREPEIPDRYPYIVVIIDELADLMQTAPAEIEIAICRIAQKARAAGIHLILATQTPRADVITGVIKANIPSKIAFQVSNALDSRVILDSKGAEKLVGKGDMLYLPPGSAKLIRAQGAYVTDDEVLKLVDFCKQQARPSYVQDIKASLDGAGANAGDGDEITDEDEDCYEKCLEVIAQEKRASTSLLQRRLRLGYTRAARMMDIMERRGIIGPGDGAKPREILVTLSDYGDGEG
ncbi:MAG: DNA translocase FtsK 4TM domain-containing protein [Verrucomicrobiales bacterium]